MTRSLRRAPYRFGVFELDVAAGELRKHGTRIRLTQQAFRVLQVLVEQPGTIVSRDDLRQRLWPEDTFVEFDHGLNNAVSRLRQVLGDAADNPRFVETVPRRGYRFVASVEHEVAAVEPEAAPPARPSVAAGAPPAVEPPAVMAPPAPGRAAWRWPGLVLGLVALVASAVWTALVPGPAQVRAVRPLTTIAVLPFAAGDEAEESDDRFVAFGMTEALTTELSHIGALRVISQTSAMQYQGVRKPLTQIAGELGAGTIVEGSVLRDGDDVRVTVQLIDAHTDTHLWAQSYARQPATALAGQRQLAREIAAIIRSRLAPSDRTPTPLVEQTNAAAYEAYVRGRYFMQQPGEASLQKGRTFYEQSIAADPEFALAHAGLSNYFVLTDEIPPDEAMTQAKASALRALALDDDLAAAHAALAYVHYFGEWDWAETERRFHRAIELDPNDAWSRRWHALYLNAIGHNATAIEEITRAIELDPVSVSAYDAAGAIFLDARQFDRVLEQAQRIDELIPGDPRALMHFATGYFHLGQLDRALDYARRAVDASGREAAFLCVLAGVQHRAGLISQSEQTLAEVMALAGKGYVPDVFLAITTLWMRGADAALPLLQRAYERRDGYFVIVRSSPWFDPMRGHPGYEALVRRMNFPG